jgi:superfamily II DNA helicase RecQ
MPVSPVTWGDDRLLQVLSLYTKRSGSVFTSDNQRRLLLEVLTGEHESIIAVLPTGAGKSIAIFGPVLAENDGITIVITCYTALRRQLAEQARSFGIKHLVWSDRNLPNSPNRTSVNLVIMITDDIFSDDAKS